MEQIEYTRTVVPSSMRSPYWKYFGFPSDNCNNILTRQKIVCTICNSAIAYNKNTSNLRTHLMSKHVEIFQKIVTLSNATLFTNQDAEEKAKSLNETQTKSDHDNDTNSSDTKRRRHIEAHEVELPVFSQNKNNFGEHFSTIPEYSTHLECESNIKKGNNLTGQANKIDLEMQSTEYIAFLPSNGSEIVEVIESRDEVYNTSTIAGTKHEVFTYTHVDFHEEHDQHQQMDIMLADLIQTDLLPLYTLEEHGFSKYNHQLTGLTIDDDTVKRVIKVIETRFTNIKQIVTSNVYRLSRSQPYSLSLEIYKDNEAQDVLNIYFNYLNDNQTDLLSILHTSSTICNKSVDITKLLVDINLKNCSGVVVTCLDNVFDFVSEFTKFYDLPLIECLESMLTRCLQKIFEQTEFRADYEKLLKTNANIKSHSPIKTSNFTPRCKWDRLNFLEHIFQNVEQSKLGEWDALRQSFEYLKPLKIAWDIITDEPLPLCSLTRPLIKKLFEEHFSSINQEESRLSVIQKILKKELYERIMAQHFLNEATFFDMRFHRDFALQEPLFDIKYLKTQVVKRFKHIVEVAHITKINNIKIEQNSTDSFVNNRKCSSLKSFFKRDDSLPNDDHTTDFKTNLDLEFEQYQTQTCLDLDQSPVLCWQQQSENYKQLSKIAKHYLTIPGCCLPRLCRIDSKQRYVKLDRRNNLSQFCSTESKLWYLYYNEAVAEII